MKALNCKFKFLLMALLLAGSGLYAQEVKKELSKEFSTNKSTVLSIDSKFCNLTLENWDKDKAVFDVTIKIKNTEEANAKKLLEQIKVNFEQNGDRLIVETILDDNFTKGVQKAAQKFTIDIVGKVPSYLNLDITNKFGSANLGSFSGSAKLHTSFGAMEVEQLTGKEISIKTSQGSFSIGTIADAEIEANMGQLTIINASNLDLESNQGETKISSIKNLTAEVNMGSCIIKHVDPSFEILDIEMNAGLVELGIDENAGFKLDVEMKLGNIDLPNAIGKIEKGHNGMNSSFEGTYGNGKSTIRIEGKLGNIELKLK